MINQPFISLIKNNSFGKRMPLALWVILGFTCLYCLSFFAVFPSNKLLAPIDGWRFFAPAFYAKKSLWLDLICAGYPQIADPQFQIWYPLARIFQCFHSYNGFIISAYILASCFAYLFSYTLTNSKLAATISGVCFGMSGFLEMHLQHASMLHAAVWTPLVLTAIEKLRQKVDIFWFAIGSIAIFMTILGGHPQISFYGLGLSTIYVIYAVIFQKQQRLRYCIAIIEMFIIGTGLAAIQIIPTIEWMHQSIRESISYAAFIHHPIIPVAFWQLVYPNLYSMFYQEVSCYAGILPLLLLLFSIFIRPYKADFLFWLSVTILAACLMLGNALPLAKFMYHIPVYNLFRIPCRHGLEFTIALSTLSGLIISYIQTAGEKKSLLGYGVASCALFIVLIVLGTYYSQNILVEYAKYDSANNLSFNPLENQAIYTSIIIIFISITTLLIWLQNVKITWRKILLITTFTFDMFTSVFWFSTIYPASSLPEKSILRTQPPIALYMHQLLDHNGQRLFPLPTYGYMNINLAIDGIAPNLSMFWNIPIASGYPARFKRYTDLLRLTEYGHSYLIFDSVGCEFDLASVKYIIAPEVKLPDTYPDPSHNKRFRKFAIFGPSTVYENLHAMPRAWLAGEVISLPAENTLQTIHSCKLPDGSTFNPAKSALVEDTSIPKIKSDITNGAVQTIKLKNTYEEFKTNCSKPAMLVVSDLFYPGWEARIDGQPTKIYITDYAFRGVFVKAGEHQVTFEYKPKSLYWGIAISSLSLLILIVITISTRLKRVILIKKSIPE